MVSTIKSVISQAAGSSHSSLLLFPLLAVLCKLLSTGIRFHLPGAVTILLMG